MTSSAAPTRWGWRCRSGQTFEERNLVPQVLCSASWAPAGPQATHVLCTVDPVVRFGGPVLAGRHTAF